MLCVMAVVDSADAWQHPARAGLAQKMHKAATTATSCRDIFLQESPKSASRERPESTGVPKVFLRIARKSILFEQKM